MADDLRPPGLPTPQTLPAGLLASFLDAVPASVAILDKEGDVIAVNAAWRCFAADNGGKPENWKGCNYLDIADKASPDEDAMAIGIGIRSVLAGDLSSYDREYPCHGNDVLRWFRCLVAPLTMVVGGMIAGAAIMHIDVTAQKLAEERALSASRAKTEFLASMSHELRTPLNAVIGFSEMQMLEVWGPLDDRYKGYASDIHQAGKHLLSLINEVLDLSKVEAGRFDLREEALALPDLLRTSLRLVEDRAARAEVSLVDEIVPTPTVRADARLIRQIVLNLLSNAIKFTPPGGRVTVHTGRDGEGRVLVSVADTGIGIEPHDIPRVLEPFGQVDSEQARRYQSESTGLGLPLCKRFAELHQGELLLKSCPGQGTTITVALPASRLV